jgi:S1-C subfamily serine protease
MRNRWKRVFIVGGLLCLVMQGRFAIGQDQIGQDQGGQATPPTAAAPPSEADTATFDSNDAIKAALAQLKQADDGSSSAIDQAKQLLTLDVCDPATKAKIEALLADASSALDGAPQKSGMNGLTGTDNAAIQASASTQTTPLQTASLGNPAKILGRDALVARLNAMTVFVLTPKAFGSGIVVGPNMILTNRHVIEPSKGEGIIVMNKAAGLAKKGQLVAMTDSSNFNSEDFALISIDGTISAEQPQLATNALPLDAVIAAGYPGAVISNDQNFRKLLESGDGEAPDLVLSSGIINTIQNSASSVPVIVHTAEISPGSSGGPLVNQCGQVVGINTFLNEGAGGTARFAISAKVIDEFLSAHQIHLPSGPNCAVRDSQ